MLTLLILYVRLLMIPGIFIRYHVPGNNFTTIIRIEQRRRYYENKRKMCVVVCGTLQSSTRYTWTPGYWLCTDSSSVQVKVKPAILGQTTTTTTSEWIHPFTTGVPFWGQSSQSWSNFSPNRNCGPNRVLEGLTKGPTNSGSMVYS